MNPHTDISLLLKTPEFTRAIEREKASIVEERRARIAAIERLDDEAKKAWPKQERVKAASQARVDAALEDLKIASIANQNTLAEVARERFAFEHARQTHERALIVGGVPELVAEFEKQCWRAAEAARASSNFAAAERRLRAIRASLRDLPRVRCIADPRDIPTELEKLRENWSPLSEDAA
jgi:hypothetical protein